MKKFCVTVLSSEFAGVECIVCLSYRKGQNLKPIGHSRPRNNRYHKRPSDTDKRRVIPRRRSAVSFPPEERSVNPVSPVVSGRMDGRGESWIVRESRRAHG